MSAEAFPTNNAPARKPVAAPICPIAAALAAGETPSPEMVAAAPTAGALKPAIALGLLAAFVVVLAVSLWLTKYTAVYRNAPLDQPPEVLRARARDIIKQLGYTDQPADTADGFVLKEDYLRYIAAHDQSPSRWNRLRMEGVGPYRYWYRQSPRYFDTIDTISVDRPALDVSGMTSVYLDMEGRLHWFVGVPPQREPPEQKSAAPDWSIPFRQAGLDIANFQSVASRFVPLHAYDMRAAWDGADPAHPELQNHVQDLGQEKRINNMAVEKYRFTNHATPYSIITNPRNEYAIFPRSAGVATFRAVQQCRWISACRSASTMSGQRLSSQPPVWSQSPGRLPLA